MALRSLQTMMWADACAAIERAERLRGEFYRLRGVVGGRPQWEPPVDLVTQGDTVFVMIALPGVTPEQVLVQLEQGILHVSGERPVSEKTRHGSIERFEIPYGRFDRYIGLPLWPVKITRNAFENGCLVIELLKQV